MKDVLKDPGFKGALKKQKASYDTYCQQVLAEEKA